MKGAWTKITKELRILYDEFYLTREGVAWPIMYKDIRVGKVYATGRVAIIPTVPKALVKGLEFETEVDTSGFIHVYMKED